jgi:hypothetical protein
MRRAARSRSHRASFRLALACRSFELFQQLIHEHDKDLALGPEVLIAGRPPPAAIFLVMAGDCWRGTLASAQIRRAASAISGKLTTINLAIAAGLSG